MPLLKQRLNENPQRDRFQMKRQYYHNKHIKSTTNTLLYQGPDKEYNQDDYCKYLRSPYIAKLIAKASKSSKVTGNNLMAISISIGGSSHNYITTAAQSLMAKNANVSISTFKRGLYALRKNGLVVTKHRYTGDIKTRRRTTSLTILKAFADFCVMAKQTAVRTANCITVFLDKSGKSVKSFVDSDTGELFDTGPIVVDDNSLIRD